MRARTTWNTDQILAQRTAATTRTADPYAMNQDHLKQQPAADAYLTGDPSAFAEDITTPNNWQVEYQGGAVKRNEIGMPEVRPDTFNHPEKTASVLNEEAVVKKADIAVRIARRMLGNNVPEGVVEDQAASIMLMPDADVINTYNRLAGEMPPQFEENAKKKQEEAKQQEASQAQEQVKQAALKGDKVALDAAVARLVRLRMADDQQQAPMQQQGGQQQQQAQGQPQQAPAQQQAGQQQQQSGQEQQSAWYDSKGQRPGHSGPDTGPYAGQQQQAQGQGQQAPVPQMAGQGQFPGGQFPTAQGQPQTMESQVQQMIDQAASEMQMQASRRANDPQQAPMQQQSGQQQQQQAGQQQQAQGQPQQAPAQQQAGQQQQAQCGPMQQQGQGQMPMQQQAVGYQQAQGQPQGMPMQASDDQLIDQMLAPAGGAPGMGGAPPGSIAEMDIQMEAPSMDIGDVSFANGEEEYLRQLFATGDEAMAAQQAQDIQQGQGQGQPVQASNVRTAALRTVGTRPTAGVARIGGAGSAPSRDQDVNRLSSLWQSAPDVREVFGLKTT